MRVTVKEPAILLAFLQSKMPEASTTKLRSLMKHHSVLLDGTPVMVANTPIAAGQVVEIVTGERRAVENARRVAPFTILYEDDYILAVDKPRGMLSIARDDEPGETLYQAVFAYVQAATNNKQRCFIVHRLDREVSGVMIFAKTDEAKRRLQLTWDHNEKVYMAVVEGIPHPEAGIIEAWLDEATPARVRVVAKNPNARHAVTHYRVIKQSPTHALVEVRIETGRRHQIRAHLASIGCPIAGDKRYGARTNPQQRLSLHAARLVFDHPVSKQRVKIESPMPASFRKLDARTVAFAPGRRPGGPPGPRPKAKPGGAKPGPKGPRKPGPRERG